MDPTEERRHSKRQHDHINMLGFVSDSEYVIPKRCPCGGRIIDEVRRKDDYDTLPGKRFFTYKNYEADGFHYRQTWVISVQDEIERLTKRAEEAEEVMLGSSNLCKLIDRLEDQVKILSEQVDDLTVQVATLEKMDPAEERRHSKRQQDHINMLGFVSDSEYGIPKRCPCGGRIIDEVRRKDDYDTLPGKRFFTCKNYEADGFHYRQPWVIGVQEEIERLTKRVVEAEEVMLGSSNLCKLIDRLEDQVKMLSEQVDDLTVQVATLEKSSPPKDVDSAEAVGNSPGSESAGHGLE
uniref:Zinc finger GRF-type domain-containing protein n=1 Tax=Brassica campestris TaxID=3711 RepID=M4E692_BRACM